MLLRPQHYVDSVTKAIAMVAGLPLYVWLRISEGVIKDDSFNACLFHDFVIRACLVQFTYMDHRISSNSVSCLYRWRLVM